MIDRSGSDDCTDPITRDAAARRLGEVALRNMDLGGITTYSMSVSCLANDTGTPPVVSGQGPSKGVITMAKKPETEGETSPGTQLLQSILATRVREARRNAKLKQSDLAALVGSSQSFIFLVEAADANITIKSLVKIADALKVNPIHLLMSKETSALIEKGKVENLSILVENSLQELHATTSILAKINEFLQQVHKTLADQKANLSVTHPLQD